MSENHQPEPLWRWPNSRNFSPTVLKNYGRCASRAKMQYLQKLEGPGLWIRNFGLGNAAHSALSTIAQQLKAGSDLIGEEQVRNLCRFHLPEREYPTPEAREADIQLVLLWVNRGRSWLEKLDVQEWLLIEKFAERSLKLFPSGSPYTLVTRPDLVVKRLDDEGEPYFQIVDWKTGMVNEEPDVPIIMRYVIRERLQEWFGDASNASVQFTWYWLDENYRKNVDLSVDYCNYAWPGILEQMESLATETEWLATPGRHCEICPYYQNHCPEEIPPGAVW